MKKLLIVLIIIIGFGLISAKKENEKEFSVKMIESSLAKVGRNISMKLYASKFETTNFLYNTFLNDLKNTKQFDNYKISKIDTANWDSVKGLQKMKSSYHNNPSFSDFPVVNISFEAANLFCKWLTDKYNTDKNRKYKKVIFRLPTMKEWEKAAEGGLKNSFYPWGGPDLQNRQGCLMCNYYNLGSSNIHYNETKKEYEVIVDENVPFKQAFLCKVDDYVANDYGLYNMSGNVKEMISQKGISKGGGFLSTGYDVRIKSKNTYDKSMVDLGFRYFMEILEE